MPTTSERNESSRPQCATKTQAISTHRAKRVWLSALRYKRPTVVKCHQVT